MMKLGLVAKKKLTSKLGEFDTPTKFTKIILALQRYTKKLRNSTIPRVLLTNPNGAKTVRKSDECSRITPRDSDTLYRPRNVHL